MVQLSEKNGQGGVQFFWDIFWEWSNSARKLIEIFWAQTSWSKAYPARTFSNWAYPKLMHFLSFCKLVYFVPFSLAIKAQYYMCDLRVAGGGWGGRGRNWKGPSGLDRTWLLCFRKCNSSWAGPTITPQIEHLHQYEDETQKETD